MRCPGAVFCESFSGKQAKPRADWDDADCPQMSNSSSASGVPYSTFDTPDPPSSPACGSCSSASASAASSSLLGFASDTVATALGLGPHPQLWESETRSLTREDVATRLRAAELAGLTESVWRGLTALRAAAAAAAAAAKERSITPTLPPDARGDGPSTPSMARQPPLRGSGSHVPTPLRVQRFVPVVERMHGRVPRSEATWQHFEGESQVMGCLRALRLVCYNVSGTLICFRAYTDELRRVA